MKNLVQFVQPIRNYYLTVGLLLMLNCFSQPLLATTLTVNNLEDTTVADERCTLREALDNANHDNAGIGDCEAGNQDDVIDLSGLSGTIILSSPLEISSNLTLEGPGAEILTLDGDGKYLVLWVKRDATVKIKGVRISHGYSGGVKNEGILTLENSTISGNWADSFNGGIYNDGNLTLVKSTVSENFANSWGGGIYNKTGTLMLNESTVSGNITGSWGGGIYNEIGTLTLIKSTVSGNITGSWGGGIYNGMGTLTLNESTVSGNITGSWGGGIYNDGTLTLNESTVSGNVGGGICNGGNSSTLNGSTVSGNSGGGILGIGPEGTLNIINSTISGNYVGSGTGGISSSGGVLNITNSTISENYAVWGIGGISSGGTLNLQNTLIANNTNGDCSSSEGIWGGINFIGDGSCNAIYSGDPKLNPMSYDDSTVLYALLPGSPAIDAGDDSVCPKTDQRGITRPQGAHCDIGALEATPVICQFYAIHNNAQHNNSQFFTVKEDKTLPLGEWYPKLDLKALDIHPHTNELYAASGDNTTEPGYLYLVDKDTGNLTPVGNIVDNGALGNRPQGYDYLKISALSFQADGSLWGWAQGEGLLRIDPLTAQAQLVAGYSGEIEDLSWNETGDLLYGVENRPNDNEPSEQSTRLLSYDGQQIQQRCAELTSKIKIATLETLSGNLLLFSYPDVDQVKAGVFSPDTCEMVIPEKNVTSYQNTDLAWPSQCQFPN